MIDDIKGKEKWWCICSEPQCNTGWFQWVDYKEELRCPNCHKKPSIISKLLTERN